MFNMLSQFQKQVKNKKKRRKWWLFNATDFQSLMYPCFISCRILGIFPYKIHDFIFEASRSRYISSTIVICITCIHTLAIFYKTNVLNINIEVARKIQDNCFFTLELFIIIVWYILNGPRMCLLQTILNISTKLSPKMYEKLSKLIHIKDIFGFLFFTARMFMSSRNYYQILIKNDYIELLCELEFYISLQVFQMNMLYINCVCILKACFQKVNDQLTNLGELMVNDNLCIPRLINHEQRNPFLLDKLRSLKKQHMIVSDTVQMLNTIFSPQLLASIIIVFIEITFELYFNMVQWQNGLSISLTIYQFDIHNTFIISYIVYNIIMLILIVWACETSKNQAMKLSTTVHDVINSTSDIQIKDELQLFSLQILHRDNIISAKVLIVDARLITAMVGIITTYLLILIQFLIIMHSCDRNNANNVTHAIR
ncbi:hypothetical protein P5V15_009568 [Pogonomyrmex californicus]